MRAIKKGSTDQSVVIRIIDSTAFTPETSVEHNTSGIDLWYRREGATKTSITEAALAALDSAHSDGGIEHIGDGYYRLDVPDAAVATGVNGVMIGGTVTGMIVIGCYVHLVDYDPQDAVRMGCTALPNAAAEASGGLPTLSAAQASNGTINANVHRWLTGTPNALQNGRMDSYLGAVAAGVIAAGSFAANALDSVWSVASRTLTAISDSSGVTTLLSRILGTLAAGTHNPQSGDAYGVVNNGTYGNSAIRTILTATGVPLTASERTSLASALEAAIINELDGTAVMQAIADLIASDMTTTDLTVAAIATAARDAILNRVLAGNHNTAGTVGKVLQDVLEDTGTTLPTAIADLPTNAELATALATAWTVTTIAEDYPADGAAATPAELLYLILSACSQFAIASTTLTTYKLDGTTTAATYTLDSATAPTSRVRAS